MVERYERFIRLALTFPDIPLTFPCSTHQEGVPNAAGDMRHADCAGLTRTSCKTFDICKATEPGINKNLARSGELFGNIFYLQWRDRKEIPTRRITTTDPVRLPRQALSD
jgi:hypothetical protein